MTVNTIPDAVSDDYVVLIKDCSELRTTRQIDNCAQLAEQTGRRLLLVVREDTRLDPRLAMWIDAMPELVELRRR